MSKYLAGYGLLLIAIATFIAILPLKTTPQYRLVQIQNDSIVVIQGDISVIRCGFMKKTHPNSHCIQDNDTVKTARNQ